ncbi:ABC-F type ribosomal protection protein [Priestia aryabhattai]|uniref:ribosomal protection-like ABC-F family protein n=1 Tax=Priestia TaxID=2800373 RepID=UPI000532D5A4|nr:ABC-F type ribosomal protection protein [Priestia aryabhattai]MBY0005713.1 ABC-F type ribosomal protection protein [Priestia aryabhattai]MBY0047606.1 ABC-F type ribosomal protection protein [Priestia aryabhattai]
MLLLEAINIEKSYGDRLLFQAEKLQVHRGERIGIVGKNGEGKSTLLHILMKKMSPDQGIVQTYGRAALIPQLDVQPTSAVSPEMKSQWSVPAEADFLSGGEETRKKIAAALSSGAELLAADEPTSHLDVKGVEKFEEEMKSFTGSLLLISHDRELLNRLCTSIWEVEGGKIHCYEGNYQEYVTQKKHAVERQQFEYEQYVKEKQRLELASEEKSQKSKSLKKAPSRMGNSEARLHKRAVGKQKAKLDRSAKAIETRIEKLEKKEKPKEMEEIHFDLSQFHQVHSKQVLSFDKVSASAGNHILFQNLKGGVKPGAKVAIVGKNGAGKSTLLNMIEQRTEGITVAKPVKLGFFHQRLENLDPAKSILENIKEDSPYTEQFIRTVLSRLLFKREDVYKKVEMLSGGERVKTALAKVFLGNYNVLLLDEPTNYLDLHTKEALQEVLKAYPGTILFVTHDRYFVKKLATHVLTLKQSKAELAAIEDTGKSKKASQQQNEAEKLALQLELTKVISELSITPEGKDKQRLEKRYEELLEERKRLNRKEG